MITNDHQRENTMRWIERFGDSLDEVKRLLATDPEDRNERRKLDVFAASYRSQIADLDNQLAEYDALRTQQITTVPLESLADLPKALVKARIAAGVTQRQVAERLGIEEERFIRDEGNDYESMSVAQLLEIAAMLGIGLRGDVELAIKDRQTAA